MTQEQPSHRSQLFTLRIWQEELSENRVEWRGQVKHVSSGETCYFRDWSMALQFMQTALLEAHKEQDTSAE